MRLIVFPLLLAAPAAGISPAQQAEAPSSAPTRSAPMSPSSPTTCSKGARPARAATTSPPAMSPPSSRRSASSPAAPTAPGSSPCRFARSASARPMPALAIAGPTFMYGRDLIIAPRRAGAALALEAPWSSPATASQAPGSASTTIRASTCAGRSSRAERRPARACRATSAPTSPRKGRRAAARRGRH